MAKNKTKVTVKGVEAVVAANKKFVAKNQIGARLGLRTWGEETMTVAKEDFVPFEFGSLRGSGTVESSTMGNEESVNLSFGGSSPAGDYAAAVHEVPASHKHGTDKYLEKASAQESSKLDNTIIKQTKKTTGI